MTRVDADELLQKICYKMKCRCVDYDFLYGSIARVYQKDRNELIDTILEFDQLCRECENIE